MRVAIIDQPIAATATAKSLDGAGHEIECVAPHDAKRALSQRAFDIVLSEWPPVSFSMSEFVASARAGRSDQVAVIVLSSKAAPPQIEAAYKAGIDDFLRKPISHAELHAKIRNAARLLTLERGVAAKRGSSPPPASHTFEELECWRTVDSVFGATLTDLFSCPVVPCLDMTGFVPAHFTEVPLVSAKHGAEIRVMLSVDDASLRSLGALMYGATVPQAALIDMLLEIGNTAAGAFTRSALAERIELTMGLPVAISGDDSARRLASSELVREVALHSEDGSLRLRAQLAVRTKKHVIVPVSKLREGMVLAKNVTSPNGLLVATAGTRITMTRVESLRALLGSADAVLEVTDVVA